MTLPDGYTDVPAGKLVFAVTCLEMHAAPAARPSPASSLGLRHVTAPAADWYRDLYRRIGTSWLWFSRLKMSDAELLAIIRHPEVEVHALTAGRQDVGLLELDFRASGECELAFFGVTPEQIGTGAGRRLMDAAIARAWSRPIQRFWVHTCTGDHPGAVQFYVRSGFRPFKRQIEVVDDPRLAGLLPEIAAPHVPIIRL